MSEDLSQEYEPLRRALDWANESGFLADDLEETNDLTDASASGAEMDDLLADEDDPLVEEDDLLETYGVDDFADAPSKLRERLRENRRDVQSLNNELSPVVGSANGWLLNFGDAQGWGLNAVIRRGEMHKCYEAILAPHHGTQAPGKRTMGDFPLSLQLIAQNGPGHRRRLKTELGLRTDERKSTADVGTHRDWW